MELIGVLVVLILAAAAAARIRWEKRNGRKESKDEAVGGWFGGVR